MRGLRVAVYWQAMILIHSFKICVVKYASNDDWITPLASIGTMEIFKVQVASNTKPY